MGSFDLSRFQGVFPAGLTFFDADGNLDEHATKTHWQWLIAQGVDGLVVAGTSGEFIALTMEERRQLFRLAVEVAGGRIPVVAGAGHAATKWTIEMSQQAQDAGADALILILPYYSRPPLNAVVEHYRLVRRNTDLPIMLYNNPGNTACPPLSPSQIVELVEEDVIHMVKSTMESVVPIHELSIVAGDKMKVFYGSFMAAYEGIAAGAHGWISGILNIVAPTALEMVRAIRAERDIERAFALWKQILPIVQLYTHQPLGPALDLPIYRGILNLWGRHGGYSRAPLFPLSQPQMELLKDRLAASGWLSPPSGEATGREQPS